MPRHPGADGVDGAELDAAWRDTGRGASQATSFTVAMLQGSTPVFSFTALAEQLDPVPGLNQVAYGFSLVPEQAVLLSTNTQYTWRVTAHVGTESSNPSSANFRTVAIGQ